MNFPSDGIAKVQLFFEPANFFSTFFRRLAQSLDTVSQVKPPLRRR